MQDPIRFYFDFSSPYGYFAALKIDGLAAEYDREVAWYPVMLGAAMKVTGSEPLTFIPMKGNYVKDDWDRLARFMKVPWKLPENFPIASLAVSRSFYWLVDDDPSLAKKLALAVYSAYFGYGIDITNVENIVKITQPLGIDPGELFMALQDEKNKLRLKNETSKAIDAGVFGSPFFIIDKEHFWGSDRLWMIKRWLKSGGW